jgi:hypothetical protein
VNVLKCGRFCDSKFDLLPYHYRRRGCRDEKRRAWREVCLLLGSMRGGELIKEYSARLPIYASQEGSGSFGGRALDVFASLGAKCPKRRL